MDFKVKFLNSEDLNNIETRRLKLDLNNFIFNDFILYMKSIYGIGNEENIYVSYMSGSKWTLLISEEYWFQFLEEMKANPNALTRMNVFYGKFHKGVICDICEDFVIGDCFKCLQCDDFDICQNCFHAKPNIHNAHCLIILRTPADRAKFLRPVTIRYGDGNSDFRVIDVDLAHMIGNATITTNMASTQTELEQICGKVTAQSCVSSGTEATQTMESSFTEMHANQGMGDSRTIDTEIQKNQIIENDSLSRQEGRNIVNGARQGEEVVTDRTKQGQSIDPRLNSFTSLPDSSVPRDYMDKLPKHIHQGLEALRSMGFKNMNGVLIALLIEKNGSIADVVDELDYGLKKK